MNYSLSLRAPLFVLMLVTAAASQAQLAVSSSVNAGALGTADNSDHAGPISNTGQSQFTTISPLTASASSTDTFGLNNANAYSDVNASWVSPAQGGVQFDFGWNLQSTDSPSISGFVNSATGAGPVWTYTFTATADGVFNANYVVAGTGNTFGLQPVIVGWTGPGGGINIGDVFNPSGSGVFSRPVSNGDSYTISISNSGNLSTGGSTTYIAAANGSFDWQVQAVPEPSAFAALGLGGLVLLRRRLRA